MREQQRQAAGDVRSASQLKTVAILFGTAMGLGLLSATAARRRQRIRRSPGSGVSAVIPYLLDHLAGSDTACRLAERLRSAQGDTSVGELAMRLVREFSQERRLVVDLLHESGATPFSVKRALGQAAGTASQLVVPNPAGNRQVFVALEALAVGVQGKRLLWRTLEPLALREPGFFTRLEHQAVRQWSDLDAMRQLFALHLFEPERTPEAPSHREHAFPLRD